MKVLITGICGFVGSTLAKAIRETRPDWDLVGIDNFCRIGSERNRLLIEKELGVEFYRGDIRNASDLEILPRCDYVIDAAANPTVLAGIDGKTSARQLVEHNLGGTVNLLEYCRTHGAGFILLSTSRIYSIAALTQFDIEVRTSDTASTPLGTRFDRYEPVNPATFPAGLTNAGATEGLSTAPPASLYGTTKVASEHLAVEYGAMCHFPVWINRCSVMGGAGQFAHPAQGIFGFWVHAFREGRPLKYIGFDGLGHQVRDGFHPRDLLPLIEKQIAEPAGTKKSPFTNLGGGLANSASLAELSAWCQTRFPDSKTVIPLPAGSPPVRAFDLPWFMMDNTRAKENWGWEPGGTLTELCEEIAVFAEENAEWLAVTG
jgi:CDP-paratose 2-epimerase